VAGGSRPVVVAVPQWPSSVRRLVRAFAIFSLWLAIGLGLGLTALVALPGLFGYQALTVVSGSMEPTLGTGSVVIDEVISPLDASPGDIVTFADPANPRQLTHRLKRMRVKGDTAYMVTLGDANDAPEHWTVPVDGQIGRVQYQIPKLGYMRAALTGREARLGLLGAVMLLGGLLVVDIWRPRRRP
jgi:signal peptidase I